MSENSKRYGSPFKTQTIDTHFAEPGKISRLTDIPGKIIRDSHFDTKNLENITRGKKLMEELESKYEINIPPFDIVLGNNDENQPAVLTVTSEISGTRLDKINFPSEDSPLVLGQLDKFYSSLVNYFSNKYKSGEPFLIDITSNYQYVYGSLPNNDEKKDLLS